MEELKILTPIDTNIEWLGFIREDHELGIYKGINIENFLRSPEYAELKLIFKMHIIANGDDEIPQGYNLSVLPPNEWPPIIN